MNPLNIVEVLHNFLKINSCCDQDLNAEITVVQSVHKNTVHHFVSQSLFSSMSLDKMQHNCEILRIFYSVNWLIVEPEITSLTVWVIYRARTCFENRIKYISTCIKI